jgi:hypothetical protein
VLRLHLGQAHEGHRSLRYLIGRRFELACEKLGLNMGKAQLSSAHFSAPKAENPQLNLF